MKWCIKQGSTFKGNKIPPSIHSRIYFVNSIKHDGTKIPRMIHFCFLLHFFYLFCIYTDILKEDLTLSIIVNGNLEMSVNDIPCRFCAKIDPNARSAIPETIPNRFMVTSNSSSCHFLLVIQWLYRILENVTDVYNGTHFCGAIQNKKLSSCNL